ASEVWIPNMPEGLSDQLIRLHIALPTPRPSVVQFIHLLVRDHFGIAYCLSRVADVDPEVQFEAEYMLGFLGDSRVFEKMFAVMNNKPASPNLARDSMRESNSNRLKAIAALGGIGDRRAVEPLIAALNDSDTNVGFWAARALGDIGDRRSVEALI